MVTKQESEGSARAYTLDESGKRKDSCIPFDGCWPNFCFNLSLSSLILYNSTR